MNAIPTLSHAALPRADLRALRLTASVLLLGGLSLACTAAAAPQGELDPGFGDNGRLILAEVGRHAGAAIAEQPSDAKLVIAGYGWSTPSNQDFAVTRLNPDGSLDESFGTDGTTLVDFDGNADLATRIAVQPDGKILVVGVTYMDAGSYGYTMGDFALARLNADGTLDTSFDNDGRVTLDLGGDSEEIRGLSLLTDGRFVVAGTTDKTGRTSTAFARFDANGALDTTFGEGSVAGTEIVDIADVSNRPSWLATQADQKILACGWSAVDNEPFAMFAVRLNTDGSRDSGFAADGIFRDPTTSDAIACAETSDGKLALAGIGSGDLLLARLHSDGTLDTTFGDAGFAANDLGGTESLQSMTVLVDGSLAVAGTIVRSVVDGYGSTSNMPDDMFVARIDPDSGMLTPEFGENGVTTIDFGTANRMARSGGRSVIQQADGKLVVLGAAHNLSSVVSGQQVPATALARLEPDGSGSAGWLGFVMTSESFSEGDGSVSIGVRRTGGSVGDVSVNYSTVENSAHSNSDFTESSGTLTWMSGDTGMQFISVPIVDDTAAETSESFTIELSNATAGLAASRFDVNIADNEPITQPPGNGGAIGGIGGGAMGAVFLWLLLGVALLRRATL